MMSEVRKCLADDHNSVVYRVSDPGHDMRLTCGYMTLR